MADPEPPIPPEPPQDEDGGFPPASPPVSAEAALEGAPLAPGEPIVPPLEIAEPGKPPKPVRPKRRWFRKLLVATVLVVFVFPVGLTLVYRFVPPPITLLMVQRLFEGQGLHKRWRSMGDMSPSLAQAVIAAEDARFCEHHGFDFKAIEKAIQNNQRRPNRMRGASTISQQTAKNVFLWPGRNFVRKGLEVYFTVLIEGLWGKRRIIEVYMNVAEWGPGTFGAEAAAQRYFKADAEHLTRAQSARLAAILPSPLRWKAVSPGPYVAQRSRRIGAAAATVRETDLSACVR